MFNVLTSGFLNISETLLNSKRINKDSVFDIVYNVKKVLLGADLDLSIVDKVCTDVEAALYGQKLLKSSLKDVVLYSVYKSLYNIFPSLERKFIFDNVSTKTLCVLGSQGSGKTSAVNKIAYFLKSQQDLKVAVISFDFSRPSGYEQLEYGAKKSDAAFLCHDKTYDSAINAYRNAFDSCKYNIIIVDTGGFISSESRSADVNKSLFEDIKFDLSTLVVDSMFGRSKVFDFFLDNFHIDGFIFTKTDADTSGGVLFNVVAATKKPVFFISDGEKVQHLSYFNISVYLKKMLGIGDVSELKKKFFTKLNKSDNVSRAMDGKINFNDLLSHLNSIKSLYDVKSVAMLIPGALRLKKQISNVNIKLINKQIAIINGMTFLEREDVNLLNHNTASGMSRIQRIIKGGHGKQEDIVSMLQKIEEIKLALKK